MTDEILTIKQVADYLKVNERTIYRLAASSWRFKRSALEAWIQARQGRKR
jgi:predicted DNA-binding transcriptional regulator AlpA